MAKAKDKRKTIPIRIGGMYPAGDAALIPAGATRNQRNVQPMASVWGARSPFVSDFSVATNGDFIGWEDASTNARRLVVVVYPSLSSPVKLYTKSVSGETYGAGISSSLLATDRQVLSSANFRGTAYFSASAVSSGVCMLLQKFDGVASGYAYAFGPQPRAIVTYIDRMVAIGGNLVVANLIADVLGGGLAAPYDPTTWTATNVTATNVSDGTRIRGRVRPSNATTASLLSPRTPAQAGTSGLPGEFTVVSWLGGVSATYEMPVTLQAVINYPWAVATSYAVGDVVVPTTVNAFRYRCTIAGTSHAATEPTWPTTLGTTVTDNTITWICDGPRVIGSRELSVPTVSDAPNGVDVGVRALLPVPFGTTKISINIVFGNTSTPTVSTDASIDISIRDGITDGGVGKANKGQQITRSDFAVPFFNQESSASATIDIGDKVYLSEPGEPTKFTGQVFYLLRDTADPTTAGAVARGRLCIAKRRSITTYVPNEADPDNPLIREAILAGTGAIGSRAMRVFRDVVYGIGENFVWRWQPGGEFVDLCGDGMRDTVMDKSSATWVESQATYNVPIMTIDEARQIVYIYTQKGRIFGYRIPTEEWFVLDVNAYGFEVRDMLWHQGTGKLYVSWGGQQVSRLDHTVSNQSDAVSDSGTTYPIVSQTDLVVEFRGPQYDVILDRVNAYIKATADQTGQVFYVYVSEDQGQTFAIYNEITLPTGYNYQRVPIDLYQLSPSFIVRLEKHGNGGGENYTLSSAEAEINVIAGAFPTVSPAPVGSSLT